MTSRPVIAGSHPLINLTAAPVVGGIWTGPNPALNRHWLQQLGQQLASMSPEDREDTFVALCELGEATTATERDDAHTELKRYRFGLSTLPLDLAHARKWRDTLAEAIAVAEASTRHAATWDRGPA